MNPLFKKSLLFSLLGHFTVFSIFGLSFGAKMPDADYAAVSFWGDILLRGDLTPRAKVKSTRLYRPQALPLPLQKEDDGVSSGIYFKPQAQPLLAQEKSTYAVKPVLKPPAILNKKQVVMLYPQLPAHFLLYFQDRQTVHIELEFNIASGKRSGVITVNRKISSGNLEADLLAARYINHYLFIQQSGFPSDSWQTVKIDLSTKDQQRGAF